MSARRSLCGSQHSRPLNLPSLNPLRRDHHGRRRHLQGPDLGKSCLRNSLRHAEAKVTIRSPEYKPPLRRAFTDLGWACAALTGPATFVAAWIYCTVTWGFVFGFFLGWIPALILALVVAIATIYLWPLAAVALLYVIYRVFDIHPELLAYIGVLVGIIAIAAVWWWHVVRNNKQP